MTDVDLGLLRKPFDDGQIGHLPKRTCRDCSKAPGKVCPNHQKKRCDTCGNYMTTAHIDLDYVGHAQVTDRLLGVDPGWSWEPVGFDPDGSPAVRRESGGRHVLWIRLTVGGVSRLGVGIVDQAKGEVEKELISDAIRNASMRFGVALDLWAKGDLHASEEDATPEPTEVALPDRLAAIVARTDALPDDKRQKLTAWIARKVYNDAPGWSYADIPEGWWGQIEGLLDKATEADDHEPKTDAPAEDAPHWCMTCDTAAADCSCDPEQRVLGLESERPF